MGNDVTSSLSRLSKIIAADSLRDEEQIVVELISAVGPFAEECRRRTGDDELFKRAVAYVSYTHAFPRVGASVAAYAAMLEALLELALPFALQDGPDSNFLEDLKTGILRAEEIVDEMKGIGTTP